MREFILRALKARTDEKFDLNDLPSAGRMDLICRCISNAVFISNDLRRDTIIHVVLDGPSDPPKVISFNGAELKGINFDERDIAKHIQEALKKGKNLAINDSTVVSPGIAVSKKSFEQLVKEKAESGKELIYLYDEGESVREFKFDNSKDYVFVFGDFIGMPRRTEGLMDRLGAKRVNIGPKILFASHCITIVHNELDYRGF